MEEADSGGDAGDGALRYRFSTVFLLVGESALLGVRADSGSEPEGDIASGEIWSESLGLLRVCRAAAAAAGAGGVKTVEGRGGAAARSIVFCCWCMAFLFILSFSSLYLYFSSEQPNLINYF